MDLVVRPRRTRHVRPVVALVLVVGFFWLCAGAKLLDRWTGERKLINAWPPLLVLLLLSLVPLITLGAMVGMNIRNVRLVASPDRLQSTEWTGRITVLAPPTSAHSYTFGSMYGSLGSLLVIAGRPQDEAVVLAPGWWVEAELQAVLDAFRLTMHSGPAGGPGEIAQRYPRAKLPLSVRRPWLFSGAAVAVAIGYLYLMMYLTLRF